MEGDKLIGAQIVCYKNGTHYEYTYIYFIMPLGLLIQYEGIVSM